MLDKIIEFGSIKKIIKKDIENCEFIADSIDCVDIEFESYSSLQDKAWEGLSNTIKDHLCIALCIEDNELNGWESKITKLIKNKRGCSDEMYEPMYDLVAKIYYAILDRKISKMEDTISDYHHIIGSLPENDEEDE